MFLQTVMTEYKYLFPVSTLLPYTTETHWQCDHLYSSINTHFLQNSHKSHLYGFVFSLFQSVHFNSLCGCKRWVTAYLNTTQATNKSHFPPHKALALCKSVKHDQMFLCQAIALLMKANVSQIPWGNQQLHIYTIYGSVSFDLRLFKFGLKIIIRNKLKWLHF